MEQIIKEKIMLLEKRYKRRINNGYNKEISQSVREFWKRQADITKDQILLLQDILATK